MTDALANEQDQEREQGGRRRTRGLLIVAAAAVIVLWQLPHGRQILYPLSLLATYAHEMGHGLTALVAGAEFEKLLIYPDGSGLAYWRGDVGRWARALVAAGGLVGPSVAGATILIISRRERRARALLLVLGVLMSASALLVVRNVFAWIFVLAWSAAFVAAWRFLPARAAAFVAQLAGVVLCLALFQDLSYMFSPGGIVDGTPRPSDSMAIADALLLPYWFWGGLVALFSLGVLAGGLWWALRGEAPDPQLSGPPVR
ncbi:MAG: M50 family metallopeptidase [Deltaproteobacteria bacterium]|nr:M50 family metallopeptidase [Deltaproteobacteria bacterium]